MILTIFKKNYPNTGFFIAENKVVVFVTVKNLLDTSDDGDVILRDMSHLPTIDVC
jgi:hypothetical protein